MTVTALDAEGNTVQVPDEEAGALFRAGRIRFPAGATVRIRTSDGREGTLPSESLSRAIDAGASILGEMLPSAQREAERRRVAAEQPGTAAVEGALRGIVPGVYDRVMGSDDPIFRRVADEPSSFLRGTPTPELASDQGADVLARQEENPWAAGAGEMAGVAAGVVLPGSLAGRAGAGIAGRAIASNLGAPGLLADAAVQGVQAGGRRYAANVAAQAAAGTLEGAVAEVGLDYGRHALTDEEFTGEALAAAASRGAVFGAAGGGAAAAVIPGLARAFRGVVSPERLNRRINELALGHLGPTSGDMSRLIGRDISAEDVGGYLMEEGVIGPRIGRQRSSEMIDELLESKYGPEIGRLVGELDGAAPGARANAAHIRDRLQREVFNQFDEAGLARPAFFRQLRSRLEEVSDIPSGMSAATPSQVDALDFLDQLDQIAVDRRAAREAADALDNRADLSNRLRDEFDARRGPRTAATEAGLTQRPLPPDAPTDIDGGRTRADEPGVQPLRGDAAPTTRIEEGVVGAQRGPATTGVDAVRGPGARVGRQAGDTISDRTIGEARQGRWSPQSPADVRVPTREIPAAGGAVGARRGVDTISEGTSVDALRGTDVSGTLADDVGQAARGVDTLEGGMEIGRRYGAGRGIADTYEDGSAAAMSAASREAELASREARRAARAIAGEADLHGQAARDAQRHALSNAVRRQAYEAGSVGFAGLHGLRRAMDKEIFGNRVGQLADLTPRQELMHRAREIINEELSNAIDRAGQLQGASPVLARWREVNRRYQALAWSAKVARASWAKEAAGELRRGPDFGLGVGLAAVSGNPGYMAVGWLSGAVQNWMAKHGKALGAVAGERFARAIGIREAAEQGTSRIRRAARALTSPITATNRATKIRMVQVASFPHRLEEATRSNASPEREGRVNPDDVAGHSLKMAGAIAQTRERAAKSLVAKANQLMPPSGGLASLDRKWGPPIAYSEKLRFMRYASIVDDPFAIADEIEAGTLTPEHVEALREVYPQIHDRLVETLSKELLDAENPPSYQQRLQISILMPDFQADPSLRPFNIKSAQRAFLERDGGAIGGATSGGPQEQPEMPKPSPDLDSQMETEASRL